MYKLPSRLAKVLIDDKLIPSQRLSRNNSRLVHNPSSHCHLYILTKFHFNPFCTFQDMAWETEKQWHFCIPVISDSNLSDHCLTLQPAHYMPHIATCLFILLQLSAHSIRIPTMELAVSRPEQFPVCKIMSASVYYHQLKQTKRHGCNLFQYVTQSN